MIARQLRHPVANRLTMLFGITAIVIVAYSSSYASLWALWQTSDHRHGILVFPIAAFLIWHNRHTLRDVTVRVNAVGLLLLMVLSFAWMVARLTGVQVLEHAASLALIPAAILTLMGPQVFHRFMFPLAFLLLAIPLSDAFVPVLMAITADIATALLRLTGIPVLREGQYLTLPGGNFVVADVCSGARYLVSGVMVALLYGYLTYQSAAKRAALVIATALALVLSNGLRAYVIMAVASSTDMQYLGGRDHIYFGWVLFGVVMMLIMWAGARYADADVIVDNARLTQGLDTWASPHPALPTIAALGLIMLAVTVKPLQADFGELGSMIAVAAALSVFVIIIVRQHHESSFAGRRKSGTAEHTRWFGVAAGAAAIAILVLTPRFVGVVERAAVEPDAEVGIPVIACKSAGAWPHAWIPQFQHADSEHALAFDCGGRIIGVYSAAYASTLQGRELISSTHHPVPPALDQSTTTETRSLTMPDGTVRSIVEIVIYGQGDEEFVWYWYEIDGRIATNRVGAKLMQLMALLQRRPAGGRVVVLDTATDDDPDAARALLSETAAVLMAGSAQYAHEDRQ